MTVALILRKDLARSTASGSSLFRVPVMQQMLPATIFLICSSFSSGIAHEPEPGQLRVSKILTAYWDRCVYASTICAMQATEVGQRKLL